MANSEYGDKTLQFNLSLNLVKHIKLNLKKFRTHSRY